LKHRNDAEYYQYRINLPKEFIESHGLKEGDLVCVLPLKLFNKEEKDEETRLRELLREKLGLTEAEARVYISLLHLGKATSKELLKEIGGGGFLRGLLIKMTRKGLLLREKHQGKIGRPFYVYRPVISSEILEKGNENEKVDEDPNTKGNAEPQTNAIRGKIVKEVVAKSWRQRMGSKIYEFARITVTLPKSYVGKRVLVVISE
jgi:predicted transcriptional regulator